MKRIGILAVVLLSICVLLCGCQFWMDGEHYSVKPHLEDNVPQDPGTLSAYSYNSLRSVLESLVEDVTGQAVINVTGLNMNQMETFMDRAIAQTKRNHAIAAYAVDEITYEIGTNAGKPAVAVQITYHHSRSEILRIKQASDMNEVQIIIMDALDEYDAGVVLHVDSYYDMDFTQMVQDYVDNNPQLCVEMPQVSATVYPETGMKRVIELAFTYQTSRDVLREMRNEVSRVFSSARLYVSSDAEPWEKYSQLYSFLMERFDYVVETSITPPYSLLRHGVGDSEAFATVYSAMCRQSGLDCRVVSGTRAGEARYWNVLVMEDGYYHLDLLQSSSNGAFEPKLSDEMTGYVWDYSAFPELEQEQDETQIDVPEETLNGTQGEIPDETQADIQIEIPETTPEENQTVPQETGG